MKNRSWKREKSRQDSQESNVSTLTSSSIREFELFQQFCSSSSPTWEVPSEANEITYSWDTSLHESYAGISERPSSPAASESRSGGNRGAPDKCASPQRSLIRQNPGQMEFSSAGKLRRRSSAVAAGVERQKTSTRTMVTCRVFLLSNEEHVVEVNKKSKGRVLFDMICEHINLVEKDYFSCSYFDKDHNKVWLNMDKKMCKQIDDGPFWFAFEVKFIPSDVAFLQEDITRYLLCLQVQRDISSGRLPCSFVTYALLGSYLVQSEFGDHAVEEMAFGTSYISHLQFAPNQTEELLEKVAELHRTHRGLSPAESDLLYLLNASKLALYGVDLHEAKDAEGTEVTLGISSSGLVTYRERLRIGKYIWPRILRISYKGRFFHLLARPNDPEESDSNISFKFPTRRIAKRFWRRVVEMHSFYRLKDTEPAQHRHFPRFGSSKFQFCGRTQHQTREVSSHIDRPAPTFARAPSRSLNTSSSNPTGRQSRHSKNVAVVIESAADQQNFPTDGDFLPRFESDRSHRESPTVSCSSHFTSDCSHHLPMTPSRCSSRSEGQMLKSQVRLVTCAVPGSGSEDIGTLVSAHSHSSRTHTIEMTTYQTERDGVLETRVEKKVLLSGVGEEIDQNMVLADVIRSMANVSPNLRVEKIEIHTRSELESD